MAEGQGRRTSSSSRWRTGSSCKPSEGEQTTASGLVIPDTAKEKPQEGTVVAVGPGVSRTGRRVPLDVTVGDKVIYSKYGGTEVKVEGEEYLILSARDVLAVLGKYPTSERARAREPLRHAPRRRRHGSQVAEVQRGGAALARGRRRQARRRGRDHARAQGPQRGPRQEVGRAHHHERRCDDRQGGGARGPVGEHGRPAQQGGRHQDQRRRR